VKDHSSNINKYNKLLKNINKKVAVLCLQPLQIKQKGQGDGEVNESFTIVVNC